MSMSIAVLGLTCELVGSLLLAYTIIRVHSMLGRERKIDRKVLAVLRSERLAAIIGTLLIIAGYILEVAAVWAA